MRLRALEYLSWRSEAKKYRMRLDVYDPFIYILKIVYGILANQARSLNFNF